MTAEQLAERLLRRFKGVPGFELEDAEELIEDAMTSHGYKPSDNVPNGDVRLILLHAQSNGAWQVAFSVAHYFKYTDGEESVDKSQVSSNYRKLAKDLEDEYDDEKDRLLGSNFRIMRRVDRDYPRGVGRTLSTEAWYRRWR